MAGVLVANNSARQKIVLASGWRPFSITTPRTHAKELRLVAGGMAETSQHFASGKRVAADELIKEIAEACACRG